MKYQDDYSKEFARWLDSERSDERRMELVIWANGIDSKLLQASIHYRQFEQLIPNFYPTVFECELLRCIFEEDDKNAEKERPNFYGIYWMLIERYDKEKEAEEWPDVIGE